MAQLVKMSVQRRIVFRLVASTVGIHSSQISTRLDMSIFSVRSALSWLRQRKLIEYVAQSPDNRQLAWKPTAHGKSSFADSSFLIKEFKPERTPAL